MNQLPQLIFEIWPKIAGKITKNFNDKLCVLEILLFYLKHFYFAGNIIILLEKKCFGYQKKELFY